jgi:hypothetical protein
MKSLAGLLLAFCAVITMTPVAVQASSPRIPAAAYPPGAHIGYRPVLTNAEMDCMWGFVCDGPVPNFHFVTQDELHRVAGWAQFAGIQHYGRMLMSFELFVSRYDPVPDTVGTLWSKRAYLDLTSAIRAQGYRLGGRATDVLPPLPDGDALVAVQHLGKQDLVVMAARSETLEVEGIALYEHRPPAARQTAWASLARQVRLALKRGV